LKYRIKKIKRKDKIFLKMAIYQAKNMAIKFCDNFDKDTVWGM